MRDTNHSLNVELFLDCREFSFKYDSRSDKDIFTFKVCSACNSRKMNETEFLQTFVISDLHENHEYEHKGRKRKG